MRPPVLTWFCRKTPRGSFLQMSAWSLHLLELQIKGPLRTKLHCKQLLGCVADICFVAHSSPAYVAHRNQLCSCRLVKLVDVLS